jgi:hypothetical protein
VIELVLQAGLCPIVVGGGHNNAYPIIRACAGSSRLSVLNISAHAGYQPQERRDGSNPYTYADAQGLIRRMGMIGLHEQLVSEQELQCLDERGWQYLSLEQLHLLDKQVEQSRIEGIVDYVTGGTESVGIDVELDLLAGLPGGAGSWVGLPLEAIMFCLKSLVLASPIAYLHLCDRHICEETEYREVLYQSTDRLERNRIVGAVCARLVSIFLRHDLRL